MFQYEFFDMSQINFNTCILYIVFYICSIWIFDKLNGIVHKILVKFDNEYNDNKVM